MHALLIAYIAVTKAVNNALFVIFFVVKSVLQHHSSRLTSQIAFATFAHFWN